MVHASPAATSENRVWQPTLKRAGLPGTMTVHGLRRAHASWLLAGGAELITVQLRLGHASPLTTQLYLGGLPGSGDKALAALDKTLNGRCAPHAIQDPNSGRDDHEIIGS